MGRAKILGISPERLANVRVETLNPSFCQKFIGGGVEKSILGGILSRKSPFGVTRRLQCDLSLTRYTDSRVKSEAFLVKERVFVRLQTKGIQFWKHRHVRVL